MFRVSLDDGRCVSVRFSHFTDPLYPKGTLCETAIDGQTADAALTQLHPKDNFCRATGRKVSLARAIAALPKAVRTAIWRRYWEVCHDRG
jgi:hypothetical protein